MSASALTTEAPAPATAAAAPMSLRRYATLVGWGLLVTTLGQMYGNGCVGYLPLRLVLKDQVHVTPTEMATFFFWAILPWSFKPLAGLITDGVPLLGRRRRYYLILGSLVACGLWLMMIAVPQTYRSLLVTAFALNCAMLTTRVVVGGLLVEGGQTHRATGLLSALRLIVINVSTIAGGSAGGFLAARWFGWTTFAGALLFLSLTPAVVLLLREPRAARRADPVRGIIEQLKRVARNRDLWICGGLFFLVQVAPGLGTPLLYYQTNTLKFDPEFIGLLSVVYGVMGPLASFVYPLVCRRVRLRWLLVLAITCTVASNLAYLGYVSRTAALVIEGAAGLGMTLAQLPLFDLAARGATKGSEALAYSLMIALWNLGLSLSDVIGSALFDKFLLTFIHLVWVNAASTAAILLVIPLLPGRLVDPKEGEATPPPPSA